MVALVRRYRVTPEEMGALVEGVRRASRARPPAERSGVQAAFLLVDRAQGTALALTVGDGTEAVELEDLDGDVEATRDGERYEVGYLFLRHGPLR